MKLVNAFTFALVLILTAQICFAESGITAFEPNRTPFVIRANHEEFDYRISPLFVLPSTPVTFEIPIGSSCSSSAGKFIERSLRLCRWVSPNQNGLYQMHLQHPNEPPTLFQIFVVHPFSNLKNEMLNGYKIGRYPDRDLKGPDEDPNAYDKPIGFIEVTKENEHTLLSPHFTLGQFVCKQDEGYPKYIVLKEKLILKLERILEEINTQGIRTDSLYVMSGYRTPYYNKKIENVTFSRHIFGDAADIFIPQEIVTAPKRSPLQKAEFIYTLVERLEQKSVLNRLIGGMGFYKATNSHPPFVHVDVRGRSARW